MEYRGPWDDIDVPDVSLYDLLFGGLDEADGAKVAFDHAETGQVLTFAELKQQVDAVASWLAGRSIGAGDVVAIVLHNRPEYAVAFHGTLRTGAATSPVNPAASAHEMARQLRTTGARIVVTSTEELATVRAAVAMLDQQVESLVVVGGDEPGSVAWAELLATEVDLPEVHLDPATHIACLPVSSGTSGLPKAVMLSHRNLVANMMQFDVALDSMGENNSMLSFLPFSHIYALTTNMNYCLFRRFCQYTMSSFQPGLFASLVTTRRPTLLFVVPPVAGLLVRSHAMRELDWSSVRLVVSGAAPLDGAVGEAVQEMMHTRLVQGYGMTELSPVTHVIPVDRRDIPLDTIGMAIPNVRFRVVDPVTGEDVAPAAPGQWSEPGELWCHGPNTMLGYLGQPEATAEVLVEDGWVRTGDLVVVDEHGTTKVVDRIKELIKRRGYQIPPAEVEALLATHPDVADAAVLGRDRGDGDQVPHALLVLAEGVDPLTAPDHILHWANEQMAAYKRIASSTVVPQLPRSAAGKILRRQLDALV